MTEVEHWSLSWYKRRGIFRYMSDTSAPRVTLADVEERMRRTLGPRWIGYGYKSIDSLQRRGMMNKWPYGICEKPACVLPAQRLGRPSCYGFSAA